MQDKETAALAHRILGGVLNFMQSEVVSINSTAGALGLCTNRKNGMQLMKNIVASLYLVTHMCYFCFLADLTEKLKGKVSDDVLKTAMDIAGCLQACVHAQRYCAE